MEIHRTNVRRCLSVVLLVAMLPLVALAGEKASPHRNLIDAAGRGDLARVKALLAEGADVNARDEMGVTPLMQASLAGNTDVVRFLLDKGADLNRQNKIGMTALTAAASGGKFEIVKLLLASGADLNLKGDASWTALM